MPNRCDVFVITGLISTQATIDIPSEYDSQPVESGNPFTVEFTFVPGYGPNATAFKAYAFTGEDASDQRTAARAVIESEIPALDGEAALIGITTANYSTLTSFNTEAFSPSTPGSGGSEEMGNYTASVPVITEVTVFWGLLCIIQDTLDTTNL